MRTPPRWWYTRSWPARSLRPIALLVGLAQALRRQLYRWDILPATRLGVPVVVIGNVSAGGTGKTPLTLSLAQSLQKHGRRPGVIVRSYRAAARAPARVAASDDPALQGDEAVLLAAALSCPVWSGPVRSVTARALVQAHPQVDVVLCDDGLQHYALARDVEIAVIDAARGFGNGWLLPAGPLREAPARLQSVDAIVLNGPESVAGLPAGVPVFRMQLQGARFVAVADRSRSAFAGDFADKRLVAVAGIGNPARFFRQLEQLGLAFESHPFPDHHRYRAEELRFPHADAILMTEKDAIKCVAFADPRMWALPVTAVTGDGLLERVLERIRAA